MKFNEFIKLKYDNKEHKIINYSENKKIWTFGFFKPVLFNFYINKISATANYDGTVDKIC